MKADSRDIKLAMIRVHRTVGAKTRTYRNFAQSCEVLADTIVQGDDALPPYYSKEDGKLLYYGSVINAKADPVDLFEFAQDVDRGLFSDSIPVDWDYLS